MGMGNWSMGSKRGRHTHVTCVGDSRRRRRRRSTLLLFLFVSLIAGCATVGPLRSRGEPGSAATTQPHDKVPVYVTDYGIHSAVVLPVSATQFVEYAFGDHGYAAENKNAPWDALGALCLSFGSGFGRTYVKADPVTGVPMFSRVPKRMQRLYAPRAKVEQVLNEFDTRYRNGRGPVVRNQSTAIEWVHDRQHYSWFNNCNRLTYNALKKMGFEMGGWPVSSGFKFKTGEPVSPWIPGNVQSNEKIDRPLP